jgi:hypothetical protein
MKRVFFYLAVAAAVFTTGCDALKEGVVITEKKIVNMIESDIVVEYGVGERQTHTIKPGETRTIYTHTFHHKGQRPEASTSWKVLDVENPVMKIDGEIVPEQIWIRDYWDYAGSDVLDPDYFKATYTLVVTDELLQTVKEDAASAAKGEKKSK